MTQIITTLKTDVDGPGSYEELVDYAGDFLQANFVVEHVVLMGEDPYADRARELVNALLNKLGIEVQD